jgi:hypothetical protein
MLDDQPAVPGLLPNPDPVKDLSVAELHRVVGGWAPT